MQLCVNSVQKWVSENGFKFSTSKTVCIHFHQQYVFFSPDPNILLGKTPIKVVKQAKFLGLIFDTKLIFKSHIQYLKTSCQKALDILRVVGHTDWGADRIVLLRLYRSLVRSKWDYGCIVYGSARRSILKQLDPIHHQGLRIALCAFRTSPAQSLYMKAHEPSLTIRRLKLSLNCFLKLKCLPENSAYSCLFEPENTKLFEESESSAFSLTWRNPNLAKFGRRCSLVGHSPLETVSSCSLSWLNQFKKEIQQTRKYINSSICNWSQNILYQKKKKKNPPTVLKQRKELLQRLYSLNDLINLLPVGFQTTVQYMCRVAGYSFSFQTCLLFQRKIIFDIIWFPFIVTVYIKPKIWSSSLSSDFRIIYRNDKSWERDCFYLGSRPCWH